MGRTIKSRLLFWSIFFIISMAMVTLFVVIMQNRIIDRYEEMNNNMLLEYNLVEYSRKLTEDYYWYSKSLDQIERKSKYESTRSALEETLLQLDVTITDRESRVAYRGIKNIIINLIEECESGIQDARRGTLSNTKTHTLVTERLHRYIKENISDLISKENNYLIAELRKLETTRRISSFSGLILHWGITIILIIMAIIYSRKITDPLTKIARVASSISSGNFSDEVDKDLLERKDETGKLSRAFNTMVENLRDNINELKEKNEKLKDAQMKAEEASTTKSTFLANMSHEIRTPLNAILGFTDILKETELEVLQREYIETVHTSGETLLALINDILDISKIEAGSMVFESIDFDLYYLIESILKMIRSKVQGRSIEVMYNIQDDMQSSFKGDPTRIRQILINLIGNALKFTEHGEIIIDVKLDKEDHGYSPRKILFSVRDTGIGIPEGQLEKIFESFTQADASTSRKYGGTGLGLNISRAFVERMGGRIWVESKVGKGSTFFFNLQLEEAEGLIEKNIQPVMSKQLAGTNIIIVDDNKNARQLLHKYCEGVGIVIMKSFVSGIEAMEWLGQAERLPDIVLTDIMMPVMDGYELIKRIRASEKTKALKVISVSSDVMVGKSKQAKIKGFNGYIAKPVIRNEFVSVIRTVIGDQRKDGQIVTRHMAEEISLKGTKVLVAEDNEVNLMLIVALLNKMGCDVYTARDGREAANKVRGGAYDIVLMDVQMPELTGLEATELIRNEINTEIPIIALTAAAMKEDEENAFNSGMNDFLTKPINIGKLKQKIRYWIDKQL